MQKNPPESEAPDVSERLHIAVDRMLEPFGKDGMRGRTTLLTPDPFDTTKPNQHDTKAEFQREFDAISKIMSHLDCALEILGSVGGDAEQDAMVARIIPIIDQKLRQVKPRGTLEDSRQLVRRNVAEVGGYTATFFIMSDFYIALSERYQELQDQKDKFWKLKHRAPDYYARAIALRLAKLFAREVGQQPTYGTAADGDYPSTAYGRALEEVFEILEIKQKVRTHAKWAIQQITEEDINPTPVNYLSAMMMGHPPNKPRSDNIAAITKVLMERRSED